MRSPLPVLLCLSLACGGGSRSGFVALREPGPTPSCPYAPTGDDARISLIVRSELGDTLRSAHIHLTGRTWAGAVQPSIVLNAASPSGAYEIGPLMVGKYELQASDSGRKPARVTVQYCSSSLVRLQAVLVPGDPQS